MSRWDCSYPFCRFTHWLLLLSSMGEVFSHGVLGNQTKLAPIKHWLHRIQDGPGVGHSDWSLWMGWYWGFDLLQAERPPPMVDCPSDGSVGSSWRAESQLSREGSIVPLRQLVGQREWFKYGQSAHLGQWSVGLISFIWSHLRIATSKVVGDGFPEERRWWGY